MWVYVQNLCLVVIFVGTVFGGWIFLFFIFYFLNFCSIFTEAGGIKNGTSFN